MTDLSRQGLELIGLSTDGTIFREQRTAEASWPSYRYGEPRYANTSSTVVNEDVWVFAISEAGRLELSIRKADATWTEFTEISDRAHDRDDPAFISVACCTTQITYKKDTIQRVWVFLVSDEGNLYYQPLDIDDPHSQLGFYGPAKKVKDISGVLCATNKNIIRINLLTFDGAVRYGKLTLKKDKNAATGKLSSFTTYIKKATSAGLAASKSHVHTCVTKGDGHIYHNKWWTNGLYRVDTTSLAGEVGFFRDVACSSYEEHLQVFGTTSDGRVWHTVRTGSGKWTEFTPVEGSGDSSSIVQSAPFTALKEFIHLPRIKKIFVLMLENRSFDHMLGWSRISGTDAESGNKTEIEGLTGNEINKYKGGVFQVSDDAPNTMKYGPGHEFEDVVKQLGGKAANYVRGSSTYPKIDNSGYVYNFATSKSPGEGAKGGYGDVMKGYLPDKLPILNALATEFAVCDNWFSSMPGPTWPNRFFAMAASSAGLDDSPSTAQIQESIYYKWSGYKFQNGNLFDLVKASNFSYRIYHGNEGNSLGHIALASGLYGQYFESPRSYKHFKTDINTKYPYYFTFIEPSYGNIANDSFKGGTSQHPTDDVVGGEQLIKATYEAIRNSPLWEDSLLIITYDEHGGFYDHAEPPSTIAPGDKSTYSKHGFTFEQLGVRVPAVIVSPYTPKNIIDHKQYEHSSIPATVEAILGLKSLTERDRNANNVAALMSLSDPRTDAPGELPPAPTLEPRTPVNEIEYDEDELLPESGNIHGFLQIYLKAHLEHTSEDEHDEILREFGEIKTRKAAKDYFTTVLEKLGRNLEEDDDD